MSTGEFFLSTWSWSPVVIGISAIALVAYAKAMKFRLPAHSGYFITGVLLFFLTLASPVNALADGYLFSAHMLQHLVLLLIVPLLLLLGIPSLEERPGSKPGWLARFISTRRIHPFASWLAGLSAMWVWHERTLCDLATTTQGWRVTQIISLVVLGTIFWWPIVGPQMNRRLPPLLGVVYLFSACVGCTVLGILITFAPVGIVCPVYMHPMDRLGILPLIRDEWGITPAIDQQAGGLMMWVPACGIYVSGVIMLLARWYRAEDAEEMRPATANQPVPVVPRRGAEQGTL